MDDKIKAAVMGDREAQDALSAKLKACPFCGEYPIYGYGLGPRWFANSLDSGRIYIDCTSNAHPGICLQVFNDTFEGAAEVWNTRTQLERRRNNEADSI